VSRNVLCLVCLVAAAFFAPSVSAGASELPNIEHEFYTLDNGLEVILHEDHSTPIVGVNVWYHVGSKNERVRRSGFAHLFEHMMFQGSEHQDAEYFGPLQSVGGTLNGSTNEDRTNYWEIVPSNHLERALLLEADRMGWLLPAMTQEKLDNQRDVVRNERRQSEGQPYSRFWLDFNTNFYPKGHPYDHSVIGEHEDLEAASLDDVKDFFRSYYTPNNATLSIAGDFDPAQVKQWVEAYFGAIPAGPPVQEVDVWIPEITREKRLAMQDRVQLTRLYFAWHTPPYYHDGDADMDLAAKILGQGRTSRLYRRLVHEEKVAQDVSAFQSSQQVSSVMIAMITLRPDADPARVEQLFDEELARFAKSGPTAEEITRAKNDFEAGFVRGLQNVGGWGGKNDRLNRYNHYVGTPDYFQQDYQGYMSRTPATVQATFQRWIGPGRMVVQISPLPDYATVEVASVVRNELPEGGPEPTFEIPGIQRAELANGLKLAAMRHDELPLVRMNLIFHSGTAADPIDREGLADLAASMHFEGTKTRDKFEFENAAETLGTEIGYWTDDDYTVFYVSCLKKHLDRSMDLLVEALLEPSFPADEFADEKQQRIVDIQREKDSPFLISSKVTRKIVYGEGHPYARLGSGTAETMSAITLDEAREFSKTHLTPANATLLVVGDTDLGEIRKMAEKKLARWTGPAPARAEVPAPAPTEGRVVYLVDKPGDSQSTVSIAHVGMSRNDPDWETFYVANRILGGFFSSRLNLNLREEKGYSYGVRSGLTSHVGPGLFSMSGRVQTEVTAPALTEFLKEMEDAAGNRVFTAEELEFAKGNIVQGYSREFETISQLAGAVTDQIVYGLPDDDLARHPKEVAAVDLADANASGAKHLRSKDVAIIVVGDVATIEESIRDLELGPIHRVDRDGRLLGERQEYSSR